MRRTFCVPRLSRLLEGWFCVVHSLRRERRANEFRFLDGKLCTLTRHWGYWKMDAELEFGRLVLVSEYNTGLCEESNRQ